MKIKTLLNLALVLTLAAIAGGCNKDSASPGGGEGTGGSEARFVIVGNTLYTVSKTDLQVFDLSQPDKPEMVGKVPLGFGIETLFSYDRKLFIGAMSGMKIYDAQNPTKPVFLGEYAHARPSPELTTRRNDPVVVQNNFAYVTLRSCPTCQQGNQLDIVDITDVRRPRVVNIIPMRSPYGLGIDGSQLFVCEGDFGLKVFDLTNPSLPKQTQYFQDVKSFDVIPLRNVLMLSGKDGFWQYDYSDRTKLALLSKIPIEP